MGLGWDPDSARKDRFVGQSQIESGHCFSNGLDRLGAFGPNRVGFKKGFDGAVVHDLSFGSLLSVGAYVKVKKQFGETSCKATNPARPRPRNGLDSADAE